jgi:hypothetical protein
MSTGYRPQHLVKRVEHGQRGHRRRPEHDHPEARVSGTFFPHPVEQLLIGPDKAPEPLAPYVFIIPARVWRR